MSADGPWPVDLWDRMIRAPQRVRERLLRATKALQDAAVTYAVIGANAVGYWVGAKDEGAIRNTPNVDILLRRDALPEARSALEAVGFVAGTGLESRADFLDGADGHPRAAVRLWFCGDVLKTGTEPLPDVAHSIRGDHYQVAALEPLVRMKLSAYRTIDRVHLQDLIGPGVIDATWPERFPEVLAERLREILADPDG